VKTRAGKTEKRSQSGFTLIEVMVAAMTLLLLFFGMAQIFSKGRGQLVIDEDKRNAVAVAQARLESLREDYRHIDLPGVAANDTTYVVGGRNYTVAHAVTADAPENRATTVTVTVNWNAMVNGNTIARSLDCTTILGRSTD
jgi:prepilin-type N-terminal cleavage/methylation domain-containing protein